MNSATSASLSNASSQQTFGSNAASNAGSPAPAFSSAGSLTSEDSFSKEGADQQAPKKKHTLAKVLGGIAAFGLVITACILGRNGVRNAKIAEQIEKFKTHGEPVMKDILNKQFLVKEGSVEYKAVNGVEIEHPNNYTHMLKELLGMKSDARTQYLNDLKLNTADQKVQHQAITKWVDDNENNFKKVATSE